MMLSLVRRRIRGSTGSWLSIIKMLLSHRHQFIFIHNPKTGGTSIKDALMPYTDKEYDVPLKHNTAAYWRKRYKRIWKTYFVFGFVRNPWDRMVSRRFYQKHVNPSQSARDTGRSCSNMKEFLELPRSKQIMNQSKYFSHRGKLIVDFVGKFENLQIDFNHVCDQIKIERINLPVLNSSPRGEYSQYYDEESKMIVDKACQDDIIMYNYQF